MQWPAALSDPGVDWSPTQRAFVFACEKPEYAAIIGSPTATVNETELVTNYAAYRESSFKLGLSKPGHDHKIIALAATIEGSKQLDATYKDLVDHANDFEGEAAAFYRQELSRTVALDIPDKPLQQAYDWARINMVQAIIDNPMLGKGLSAGYGLDRGDRRPGYDWFFGRDAFWTALALDADGDFQTTRLSLDFLSRYQRQDGKMPHEVPQTASLIGPLEKTAFSFASADATPLYLIAFDDYVTHSGDVDFARQKWASLENTVKFMRSTFEANHLAHNEGVGHGWVEGGPLFPVHMEFYQAGLGVEALRAWSRLARITGHTAEADAAEAEFALARPNLESFLQPALKRYGFSLNSHGAPEDAPSVEAAVPILFDLMDKDRAAVELDELAQPKHQADWGFRILADNDARYNPSGYHNGSVWPLFTGWASMAEYRNHRPLEGYENMRANALLTYAGAAGHVTEVLTGHDNQGLTAATPHQTWSSAMVIEPLLLGMFDLHVDAAKRQIALAPQLPANWHEAALSGVRLGVARVDFSVTQQEGAQRLRIAANAASGATLDYTTTLSPHAHIVSVTANGQKLPYKIEASAADQRVLTHLTLDGRDQTIEVRTEGDVSLSYESTLPGLGETSRGVRLTHEAWSADGATWTLQLESASGGTYELDLRGAEQIHSVEGGELLRGAGDEARVRVSVQAQPAAPATLILHLTGKKK
jgi:glycogen debranching enzyme